MKLIDYISLSGIEPNFEAANKAEALQNLVGLLRSNIPNANTDTVLRLLQEREALSTTGIGGGLAVPHCKSSEVDRLVILVGRSQKGIDFQALDQQPSHLFFCLVAPPEESSLHLKALAKIARLAKNASTKEAMMNCDGAEELFRLIQTNEAQFD